MTNKPLKPCPFCGSATAPNVYSRNLLAQLRANDPSCAKDLSQSVLGLRAASLDTLFRKAKKLAGLPVPICISMTPGFSFHHFT